MKQLFKSLIPNIVSLFKGKNLLWHLLAIVLTILIVTSGFDWTYYISTRNSIFTNIALPAIMLGTFLPLVVPLLFFLFSVLKKSPALEVKGWALAQAAILGSFISSVYKAFTGRIPPPHIFESTPINSMLVDTSHGFQFGFLRGGIFWGWPSSHTTIAFATMVCLIMLYPKNKKIIVIALLYALWVGLSVSVSIHWFSEFIAGAIIGSVIGVVVGKSFGKVIRT